LLDEAPAQLVGPGTGLDAAGIAHKALVIQRALQLHRAHLDQPLEALRRLGGFELAALVAAYIASAQAALPVLVDGFVASAAALVAERQCPGASHWFMFAHESAEPGHARLLRALGAEPLLSLRMRLGEGSGAAVAVPLIRLACTLHGQMATFAEAGVAQAETKRAPQC
jgi:nicotinate-nucleotide--dimethylbenzimidazole phosphoribosyltransferase